MKSKILLVAILTMVTLFSCKQKDTEIKVEDETVIKLPNTSDEEFMTAIYLLDQQKEKEAVAYLKKGIEDLKKEGKEISGLYKTSLINSIEKLNKITADLENGKSVSTENVRENIANAEISIAHNYLSTTDIYVLEEPDNIASNRTKRHFNRVLKSLKKEEGRMVDKAKEKSKALLKEGEKLDKEYKDWEKRAKEYTKKTNEHFKQHDPVNYTPYFW
ncbi:hypothetical protein [Lutibacter citreus]|uniref:hypothetical protein n=1 Tax=Lutibacter citreus TaxID=2138210 RepID=UPI000DBE561B|nr:hypothetical protein [Lutibacter citreus]